MQNKIIINENELDSDIHILNDDMLSLFNTWKAEGEEHKYNDINELIADLAKECNKTLIYIDKVDASDSEIQVIKNDKSQLSPSSAPTSRKYAYIGTAIVYTGESNAESLALKYINETQRWDDDERKSRLATNFCFNNRAEFDSEVNEQKKSDVESKTNTSFDSTKAKVTSYVKGCLWGYKYNKGNLIKCGTNEVIEHLNNSNYLWYHSQDQIFLSANQAKGEFIKRRNAKGVPYGALRNENGEKTPEIREHLKRTNNTDSVYLHSIDADSPDFTTLKKEESQGWKRVLDAYDETLTTGKSDVVIGGYNLLMDDVVERERHYQGQEYNHTLRSNVVDIAIRQAIHSVEPKMTYPTEPNLLIKASSYKKMSTKKPWGSGAFEGRRLIDSYIKMRDTHITKTGVKKGPEIHYDPLASISTGVDAGGARLKITGDKTYDKDSILGRPHYDANSQEGSLVSINDQYIVQAQSWAGASRVATSYRAAWEAIQKRSFAGKSKNETNEIFYPIEDMVRQLLSGDISSYALPTTRDPFFESPINVYTMLERVKHRLIILKNNPAFSRLLTSH